MISFLIINFKLNLNYIDSICYLLSNKNSKNKWLNINKLRNKMENDEIHDASHDASLRERRPERDVYWPTREELLAGIGIQYFSMMNGILDLYQTKIITSEERDIYNNKIKEWRDSEVKKYLPK
jgi:hypothetical protein